MSLLENQQYKKKIEFVKSDDVEKRVTFNISISCNHDIDKTILAEIENVVNDMFLENYEDSEVFEQRMKQQKALAKLEKADERNKAKQLEKDEKRKAKELAEIKLKREEEQKKYLDEQNRYEALIAEQKQKLLANNKPTLMLKKKKPHHK